MLLQDERVQNSSTELRRTDLISKQVVDSVIKIKIDLWILIIIIIP